MNIRVKVSNFFLNIAYYSVSVLIGRLFMSLLTLDVSNLGNYFFDPVFLIFAYFLHTRGIVRLIPYHDSTS